MPRRRRNREQESSGTNDRQQIDLLEQAAEERSTRRSRRKPGRFRRMALAGLVVMAVAIGLLPNLIGWTGLHQRLLDWGTSDFAGRISVGRASLGWFQPVILDQLSATDSEGQPLVTVDRISTSNSLFGFLTSSGYGTVTIDRPVVHAALREGGSNLEDAAAKWIETPADEPESPDEPLPAVQVVVRDGTLHLSSPGQAVSTIGALQADLRTASAEGALSGTVSLQNGTAAGGGTMAWTVALDPGSAILSATSGELQCKAAQFDLAVLAPVLERIAGACRTEGRFSGNCRLAFADSGASANADFEQVATQGLRFAAQKWLGSDVLAIERLTAVGSASLDPAGIRARQLQVESEVGSLKGDGQLAWSQISQLAGGKLAAAPFQLDGEVNLAGLAAMLPQTLALHRDLQLDSGELKFNLSSRVEGNTPRVVANLDTVNLSARRGGERLVWQQPLRISAVISQNAGPTNIDEFRFQSDFLAVEGSGNLGKASFTATGDLEKLLERLRQFAPLEGWSLSGQLEGQCSCECEGGVAADTALNLLGRPLLIAGDLMIRQPVLRAPGIAPIAEPQIRLTFRSTAQADANGNLSLLQGIGQLFLGENLATAQLSAPLASLTSLQKIEFDAGISGQLDKWMGLVRCIVDPGNFQVSGVGNCSARVVADSKRMTASGLKYEFNQFAFDGYGMTIREDQVSGAGTLELDLASLAMAAPQLTLVSSSVAIAAEQIRIVAGEVLEASGQAGLRGDIHRIAGWFGLSDPQDSVQYFGNLEGNLQLSSNGQFLIGNLQTVIVDCVAARPDFQAQRWVELLREPRLQLAGRIGLAQSFNDLQVTELQVTGHAVSARIDGDIRDLAGRFEMALQGTWSPDWQLVDGLVQAWTGDFVHLAGRDSQAFTIRGPLFETAAGQPAATILPASTTVSTELKWESGNVFLLPVGPARIQASLQGSQARVDTGEIDLGGGKLTLQPTIDLAASDPAVEVAAGTVASRIQLTPAFCRDWMKFVAPLLADATTAEGSFSVRTDGLRLPLSHPEQLRGSGVVTLHNVTVGAGPLGQQLLETVQSVRTMLKPEASSRDRSVWMNLGEQEIPFAIQDGRVYHEGLKLQMKDLQVVTKGSVGIDQSLQMVAIIPIHDDWLNNQKWLEGLRGQKLEIPITGTVTKPVLDRRAIQQLTMQLGQRVAQQEVNRLVSEQTQKLQTKASEELNQLQQKVQNKLQNEVQGKLQGELRRGLDSLFGPARSSGTPPAPQSPAPQSPAPQNPVPQNPAVPDGTGTPPAGGG